MKYSLLACFVLSLSLSHSQENKPQSYKNAIHAFAGMQTANYNSPILGLQYTHGITKQWHLKTSFQYNSVQSIDLMQEVKIYEDSSIQIFRDQSQDNHSLLLKTGVQYRPIKYLAVGLDFAIGYNRGNVGLIDKSKTYDSDQNEWVWDYPALREQYPDLNETSFQDHGGNNIRTIYSLYLGYSNYVVSGASLNVAGILPIGKRWEFGLTLTSSLLRYSIINNDNLAQELNYEGKTVYDGIQNYVSNLESFNVFNNSATLSAGFKF